MAFITFQHTIINTATITYIKRWSFAGTNPSIDIHFVNEKTVSCSFKDDQALDLAWQELNTLVRV